MYCDEFPFTRIRSIVSLFPFRLIQGEKKTQPGKRAKERKGRNYNEINNKFEIQLK